MSCQHGNWSDCEQCAVEHQRDILAAALQSIATSFKAQTAPEQALMDEAAEALAKAFPSDQKESK